MFGGGRCLNDGIRPFQVFVECDKKTGEASGKDIFYFERTRRRSCNVTALEIHAELGQHNAVLGQNLQLLFLALLLCNFKLIQLVPDTLGCSILLKDTMTR